METKADYRLIQGATIIDGLGGPPLQDGAILIKDEKILEIGPRPAVAVPENCKVIDVTGKTVLPGLIDCHDHLAHPGVDVRRRVTMPMTLNVVEAVRNFQLTLDCGVTSVRDACGVDIGLKMGVEQKIIPGPRLKISLVIISQTGGHGDLTQHSGVCTELPHLPTIPDGVCDGVEGVRKKIREVIRAGADFIKIATTGGAGSPTGGPTTRQFSQEEVNAIVDEARVQGRSVMSHAHGGEGILTCLKAGVWSIEHGAYLDENPEYLKMMLDKGIFLVPTLSVLRALLRRAEEQPDSLQEYTRRKILQLRDHQLNSFQMALKAGVRIAMGTDAGGLGHGFNSRELGFMVDGGMTPMQAIVASTRTAAECAQLDKEVGTLEAGKYADLLIVEGDPLQDIRLLEKPENLLAVMQGGEIVNTNASL